MMPLSGSKRPYDALIAQSLSDPPSLLQPPPPPPPPPPPLPLLQPSESESEYACLPRDHLRYCYIARLLEEAVHLSKEERDNLPFTEIVMLVTTFEDPPFPFQPPPEFKYIVSYPNSIPFVKEDDICLSFEHDMKKCGHRMTSGESVDYCIELGKMGRYDELPDNPNAWDSCIIYHATAEDIETLDLSSGCKQALEIYNRIRETELTLLDIVKANCRTFSRYRVLYVTFRVRDPKEEDSYMIFQAEIILLVVGLKKTYVVLEIRRKKTIFCEELEPKKKKSLISSAARSSSTTEFEKKKKKKNRFMPEDYEDKDDMHATLDECSYHGLKISIIGVYDEIPFARRNAFDTLMPVSPIDHVVLWKMIEESCRHKALEIYNTDKDTKLQFVDVVRVNEHCGSYFVTFRAKDQEDCAMLFQTEFRVIGYNPMWFRVLVIQLKAIQPTN